MLWILCSYLETFFHRNEECITALGLIHWLFGIWNDTLAVRPTKNISLIFRKLKLVHQAISHASKEKCIWDNNGILTECENRQYPNYPNRIKTDNRLDYSNRLMMTDSPLMVSIYHQSHAKPNKKKIGIVIIILIIIHTQEDGIFLISIRRAGTFGRIYKFWHKFRIINTFTKKSIQFLCVCICPKRERKNLVQFCGRDKIWNGRNIEIQTLFKSTYFQYCSLS